LFLAIEKQSENHFYTEMNYRKLYTILFFCLSFQQIHFAQKKSTADLETELQQATSDSLKIALIEQIQVAYRKTDLDKHRAFLLQGLALSKQQNNTQKEAIFTREYGINYKNKGVLDSSMYYYKNASELFLSIKDSTNYFATLSSIANIKKRQGDYKNAASDFLKCISYLEKKEDKKSLLNAQIIKMNLANVYVEIDDTQKAIEMYNSILRQPVSKTHKGLLKATYNNLTASYKNTKALDSALVYAKKTEALLNGTSDYKSFGSLFTNIGSIYEEQNNNLEAKNYFVQALENYEKAKIKSGIITSYNNLGNIYTKLKDYKKAEQHLLKAKTLLEETNNNYSLVNNYKMLIQLYSKSNRFQNAYHTQQKLNILNDSIFSIEKQKAIEDVQTKYEVEKKTLETENANKEKALALVKAEKNEKYFWYSAIIGLLISLLLIFYIFYYKSRKQQQLTELKLQQTKKELLLEKQYHTSELKALKSQMNPHFLFNAMNSIQSLILKGSKEEAYTYLSKFASLIRESLNMSEKNFVDFDDEFQLLNTYLQLEKLRFKSDFEYRFSGEETIDDIKIPSMIIQPFIENSIKHGLLHKDGKKQLQIIFKQDDILTCTVIDNGIGRVASQKINQDQKYKPKSLATGFISKRFELLKAYYNTDLGFEYQDILEGTEVIGTKVIIKIPFAKHGE